MHHGSDEGMDMTDLNGRRVAILAADGVERVELEQPRGALVGAGAKTQLLSLEEGQIAARDNDLEDAGTFDVDGLVADASVDDYDALLLPGGTVNPDKLRLDEAAMAFVREFVESGKPVAAICHGPWSLLEAGVVSGRTVTSFPSIRTDLRNAGRERRGRGGRHGRQPDHEPLTRRPGRVHGRADDRDRGRAGSRSGV